MKAVILNPHFWLYILIWSLFVGGVSYWGGYDNASESARLEEQGRTVEAIQKVIDANAKTLKQERDLRSSLQSTFDNYRKENNDAQTTYNRLVADVRAGNKRMFIDTKRPVCKAGTDANTAPASGFGEEARAELSTPASEFLTSEAVSCDAAVRQLNAVIDAYEAVQTASKPGASAHLSGKAQHEADMKPVREEPNNVRTTP